MIEEAFCCEACEEILEQPWVGRLTYGAFLIFASGFLFLIGHFSLTAMLGSFLVSICCFISLRGFIRDVRRAAGVKKH
ncbi:hypothetical protein V4V45_003899 [Vibrio mimicus]